MIDVNLNEDSSKYICNSAVPGVPLWFVTKIVEGVSTVKAAILTF